MIVIKTTDRTGLQTEMELTPLLLSNLSRYNGYLEESEVLATLQAGKTIGTSFSTWRMLR